MAKRKNRRRNPGKKAEWTLFSIKGLATIAGLWWAYDSYRKKAAASDAQIAAAQAQAAAAKDPVGTAVAAAQDKFNLDAITSRFGSR